MVLGFYILDQLESIENFNRFFIRLLICGYIKVIDLCLWSNIVIFGYIKYHNFFYFNII